MPILCIFIEYDVNDKICIANDVGKGLIHLIYQSVPDGIKCKYRVSWEYRPLSGLLIGTELDYTVITPQQYTAALYFQQNLHCTLYSIECRMYVSIIYQTRLAVSEQQYLVLMWITENIIGRLEKYYMYN